MLSIEFWTLSLVDIINPFSNLKMRLVKYLLVITKPKRAKRKERPDTRPAMLRIGTFTE